MRETISLYITVQYITYPFDCTPSTSLDIYYACDMCIIYIFTYMYVISTVIYSQCLRHRGSQSF